MSHKRWSYLVAAISLIAAVAACNTPGGPAVTVTMPPIDIPTVLPGILSPTPSAATAGPVGAQPTATSQPQTQPTQAPQPTRIPATAVPAGPPAKRVSFATGATQARVTGSLAAGGADRYVLGVGAGQVIEVGSEQPDDIKIKVTGANGALVANGGTLVRGIAPSAQDYTVQISAGSVAANYHVLIVIPERVSFAKNATEATIQGQVAANETHHYSLGLGAGQLADIQFSTSSGFHSALYGVDGKYLQGADGTGVGFRGQIPTSQDYVLAVVGGAQPVSYTIHVIVPQRITFGAGATWIDAQGTLPANSRFQYVLNLQAGQALEIQSNAGTGYTLAVTGVDGTALAGGSTTTPFFRGKVPVGGDTIVTLTNGAAATSYDLSIIVPIRISFASGANSATQTGTLKPHEIVHYVVAAGAGQTLDALFTPANTAKMTIYGNDGTVQWSGMGEGTHWSGSLPGSQDYFITFQAGDSAVGAYTLKVTIN